MATFIWATLSARDTLRINIASKPCFTALLAVYYALRPVCGQLITAATQLWLPVALIVIKWVGLNVLGTRSTVMAIER